MQFCWHFFVLSGSFGGFMAALPSYDHLACFLCRAEQCWPQVQTGGCKQPVGRRQPHCSLRVPEEAERGVLGFCSRDPVTGHVGMAPTGQKEAFLYCRVGSDPRKGFLERCLMPHACQCVGGICIVPLITSFNFWSALK